MKLNKAHQSRWLLCFLAAFFSAACSKNGLVPNGNFSNFSSPSYYGSPGIAGLPNGVSLPSISGNNVMQLSVNGSLCSAANSNGYINKPCVSVTICDLSGTNCTTINDILLDTGSFGLRVFNSVIQSQNPALASALTPIQHNGAAISECVNFLDNSADWGSVALAKVTLAGEDPVTVPIQVIDSTLPGASKNCANADSSPVVAGFNGILGVGVFAQDCGFNCSAGDGLYFTCSGAQCTGYGPTLAEQVTNPVSALAQDNNGVIIELPSLVQGGQASVDGYVILGIGTQANNMPGNVQTYAADPQTGQFLTSFGGQNYPASFLDSGSNTLAFQPSPAMAAKLPDCGSNGPGYFCPTDTIQFSGTTMAFDGSNSSEMPFLVGNALTLANTGNMVFMEIADNLHDGGLSFDWGLPFFYGRNIYVGIEGKSSPLAAGTYWAY